MEMGMQIGFCGAGPFGLALGERLARAGHDVVFGVRNPADREPPFGGAALTNLAGALKRPDAVFVALPGFVAPEVLAAAGGVTGGRVLVDCTNLLNSDWSPAGLPDGRSNAERLQSAFSGARVVKAFNTVFADMLAPEPDPSGALTPATFICGDDGSAVETVASLARDIGLNPIFAGDLAGARHLEAMAHLHIRIAMAGGLGTKGGFAYLQNLQPS
jgi:predicted dinucleotide-binding enzyme